MSELYDAIQRADVAIERLGLDPLRTRGQLSVDAGFMLGFVGADDPDDPVKLEQLRAACKNLLGEDCGV